MVNARVGKDRVGGGQLPQGHAVMQLPQTERRHVTVALPRPVDQAFQMELLLCPVVGIP